MKRSNTQSLSDLLKLVVDDINIEKKLKEVDIVQSWETLLGKTIARYTNDLTIDNGTLYVKINSSVVKNELFMMREEICKKLNDQVGDKIVDRIIFT